MVPHQDSTFLFTDPPTVLGEPRAEAAQTPRPSLSQQVLMGSHCLLHACSLGGHVALWQSCASPCEPEHHSVDVYGTHTLQGGGRKGLSALSSKAHCSCASIAANSPCVQGSGWRWRMPQRKTGACTACPSPTYRVPTGA